MTRKTLLESAHRNRLLAARFTIPAIVELLVASAKRDEDAAAALDLARWHWSDNEPSTD